MIQRPESLRFYLLCYSSAVQPYAVVPCFGEVIVCLGVWGKVSGS